MPIRIPIAPLLQFSPFDHDVWPGMDLRLSPRDVQAAIDANQVNHKPFSEEVCCRSEWEREDHAERVAYLVLHGWEDPIDLDVGVPCLGAARDWWVTDGHHRLAAAIFRGDTTILVEVSGQTNYAATLLGIPEQALRD